MFRNTGNMYGRCIVIDVPRFCPLNPFCLFCRWNSPLIYIYTSGTTGLPKASKITHLRFFSSAVMFSVTARLRSDDRFRYRPVRLWVSCRANYV